MPIPESPAVYVLPVLRLTKVSTVPLVDAAPIEHQIDGQQVKYWREPITSSAIRWTEFGSFPLVLDGAGAPWPEACLWLVDKAETKPRNIESLKPLAQDLAAYKAFLDELALDWDDFSSVEKYTRPTYLYKNHLQDLVNDGKLAQSTAARRMSTIIAFYRFLMQNSRMSFTPANEPWVERSIGIAYLDAKGFKQVTTVISTDVSIKTARQQDQFDETILDGGTLRPLSEEEQKEVIKALKELGNIEYSLMHFIALLTGAREMTVLTLRLRDFVRPTDQIKQWPHKLLCGPGTGIDTKRDKSRVNLVFPRDLYAQLHSYAVSDRAIHRRAKTERGEDHLNYLFLTQHGQPYYESKEDRNAIRNSDTPLRRSTLAGRPLRKFIEESVTPLVRKTHPSFKYRFHDLRASFGMNWVDYQMNEAGPDGLGKRYLSAREQLRKLMWHKSSLTTDKYLEYRENSHHLKMAKQGWNDHIIDLIRSTK